LGGTGVANPDAGAGITPDKHEQEGGGDEVSVPLRNFQNFESDGNTRLLVSAEVFCRRHDHGLAEGLVTKIDVSFTGERVTRALALLRTVRELIVTLTLLDWPPASEK
jgi:hypothetical protein